MKLSGAYTIPVPQERGYALLLDPAILARCLPGCDRLDRLAESEYGMRMKMMLASFNGFFDGRVRLADLNPPASFRLVVEGAGKVGIVKGDGLLTLSGTDGITSVNYDGEVQLGGVIANVGQRLLDTTARMLIKRFFEAPPAKRP